MNNILILRIASVALFVVSYAYAFLLSEYEHSRVIVYALGALAIISLCWLSLINEKRIMRFHYWSHSIIMTISLLFILVELSQNDSFPLPYEVMAIFSAIANLICTLYLRPRTTILKD